jgi:hypothetical protein
MKITDTAPDEAVTVTPVHAGDVLASARAGLLRREDAEPGEAVTFDFPDGVRVFIFPTFNETYVGFLPAVLRAMGGIAQVKPLAAPGTVRCSVTRANGTPSTSAASARSLVVRSRCPCDGVSRP